MLGLPNLSNEVIDYIGQVGRQEPERHSVVNISLGIYLVFAKSIKPGSL